MRFKQERKDNVNKLNIRCCFVIAYDNDVNQYVVYNKDIPGIYVPLSMQEHYSDVKTHTANDRNTQKYN